MMAAAVGYADVLVRPVLDEDAVAELKQAILETVADALAAAAPGPGAFVFVKLSSEAGEHLARVDRIVAVEGLPSGSAVHITGADAVILDARSPDEVLEAMASAWREAITPRWVLPADFEVDSAGIVSDRLMVIP
ncbi:hypothetical protein SEA_ZETA1847_74 [Microbacterium phage Zeta1847]|uniref:Uncharacterized protein n=1 Tax=Microbacterium phage Zeta1847 TaxID=2201444 RepID=A0A2Z4QB01_9CAUD|nr:hypothetical protein HOT46_gp74 [Microbacterium phage Zeta1847]AWY06708.1 hypothetical protein SEA_ZETA1847_74 [Microbacterium phage Zeta1847]